MLQLPHKYILNIKPFEYLKQGPSHCGAFSVKAILDAYGLGNKRHPKEYHTRWFSRLTGNSLGKEYYARILNSYGLKARIKTAKLLPDDGKIKLLKSLLAEGNPVMVRIGNGYLTYKYNPFFGKIVGHWITLWGYDDAKQIFYVYDSGLPTQYWNSSLTIGNTTRTHQEILRDWKFGLWQPWVWLFMGRENYVYIDVKK